MEAAEPGAEPTRPDVRLALLTAVALAATLIVGYFLVTNPKVGMKTPGRAAGSLLGLGLWTALTVAAAMRFGGRSNRELRTTTTVTAPLAAIGSIGLAVIHVAAGVAGWQTISVAILGVTATGLAVSVRKA